MAGSVQLRKRLAYSKIRLRARGSHKAVLPGTATLPRVRAPCYIYPLPRKAWYGKPVTKDRTMPRPMPVSYFKIYPGFFSTPSWQIVKMRHGPAGVGCLMIISSLMLERRAISLENLIELRDYIGLGEKDTMIIIPMIETGLQSGILFKDSEGLIRCKFVEDAVESQKNFLEDRREAQRRYAAKKSGTPHNPPGSKDQDVKLKENCTDSAVQFSSSMIISDNHTGPSGQQQAPSAAPSKPTANAKQLREAKQSRQTCWEIFSTELGRNGLEVLHGAPVNFSERSARDFMARDTWKEDVAHLIRAKDIKTVDDFLGAI